MAERGPFADVDLNLLVVLDTLRRTRSVSRAARELGLTQSGASRALARLRAQIGDPLFVVTQGGLVPTPACEALADDLARLLEAANRVYAREAFVPAEARGQLRLGLPDHMAYLYGAAILAALHAEAPGVDLELRSFSPDWRADLEQGRSDLAFTVLRGARGALRQRKVVEDPWVVLLRRGHPALDAPWSTKRYAEGEHAIMGVPGSGPSAIDRALRQRGLSRRVVFRASSPLVVALSAAQSDLRVTTTRALAHTLARSLPLELRRLPLEVAPLSLPLVWHERQHAVARQRFFRELVAKTVARVEAESRAPS